MTTRVDTTAMCLTCGMTRAARGTVDTYSVWLSRSVLKCKTCGTTTQHRAVDRRSRTYGEHEDRARAWCEVANQLVAELAAMPGIDVRWSECRWCLAGQGHIIPTLDWDVAHPGEGMPCLCDDFPPPLGDGTHRSGAQPAGWIVNTDDGGWLVELDLRQPRDRLAGPLRHLLDDLRAGRITESRYLEPAYSTTPGALPRGYRAPTRSD